MADFCDDRGFINCYLFMFACKPSSCWNDHFEHI